jgi:hypothetical protein
MSDESLNPPFAPAAEGPPLGWALRNGARLLAAVFLVMLVAAIALAVAKSRRLAWLEANAVLAEGVVVDEVHTPGIGYQEVVEVPRGAGEEPLRVVNEEVWQFSLLERRRGVTEEVRYWPADLSLAPEITRTAKGGPPVIFELFMRGLALLLIGCGWLALRKASLLAREGSRVRGTIVDYRRRRVNKSTLHYPVVRIEEGPHAGKQFESPNGTFPMSQFPPGSSHPVLAHPAREVYDLDRPGRENFVLWGLLIASLFFYFVPQLALLLGD